MNSNRSSRALVVGLVLLVAAVAPATAALPSVEGSAPPAKQVGTSVDQTYTLNDLFDEYNEWTLTGETDLSEVTWTVTVYDNAGQQVTQETYTGQSFEHHVQANSGAVRVEVRLQATVPDVPQSLWSYQPPQQYVVAEFAQTQEGGSSTTLTTYETRPYTEQSDQARTQIENARDAIAAAEDAGVSVTDAQQSLNNAISAYNNANFDLAIDLADTAESKAEAAVSSSQTQQLIIYAVIGLVVLLMLGGGVVYYLRNRDTGGDKLA